MRPILLHPHHPRRRNQGTTFQEMLIVGMVLIFFITSCFNIHFHRTSMQPIDDNNHITVSDLADTLLENRSQHENNIFRKKNKPHTSKPLEMLHEYQRLHSQSVLMEEQLNGGIHNRTFVVGFYACPDAAGNRLHEFFNNIILAIAHNYTISWKFYDASTCKAVGTKQPRKWCKDDFNSIESCGEVVERASWIPSYDEWSEKLGLSFGKRSKVKEFYSPESNPEDIIANENKVWIPKERNIAVSLEDQGQNKEAMADERMKELYSMGTYYLYGMLFHELFPFHDSVKPSPDLVGGEDTGISIVLHSRHVKVRQGDNNQAL